ncbi:MAG: DUF4147 domain-containing protein, partial [Simkania sp.]|nr:DUF4147 domain-containing protein [Simkania sp.]
MFFDIETVACTKLRGDALSIIQAGLDAVCPRNLFSDKLSFEENTLIIGEDSFPLVGRLFVVGAGKAAGLMAEEFERCIGTDHIVAGVVNCTTADYQTQKIRVNKGGHPFPDEGGI